MADKYLSLQEALGILRITEDKFETLISNGEIKAFRTQGKVKFKDADVASLASRLESINMDSVIDDDELPSVNDSSEVMPAVEMETLEDSDFTIELPDEVVSGDPTLSSSGLSLEEEDSLVMEVDDFGLEEKGSDTNPSDITIHEEDLDLNIEDENFGTSDITLQDEVYGTSELTVQEDAINTSDLTVQEDAVNTSDLTASDDAFGTEADLTVDDSEVLEEEGPVATRGSDRRSRRTSGRMQPASETTSNYILWVILASLTLVAYIWSLLYVLPYQYYDTNNPLSKDTINVPDYMSSHKDWIVEKFMADSKSSRVVDAPYTKELFSEKAAAGGVPEETPAPPATPE
jgi:hypothetical protein